jgi:putative phage-type endonuclease
MMRESPWKTRSQMWELKRGVQKEQSRSNGAQARGHRLEPKARALYEQWMEWSVLPVCGVHNECEWLKVSLDGWNPDKQIAVEIKAPNRDDHQAALDGFVPDKYKWQVLHQAIVAGARVIHYVSYSNYFPPALSFTVVPVYPDPAMMADLLAEEKRFWEAVVEGRPVAD